MPSRAILINSLTTGGSERVVSVLLDYFARKEFDIALITLEDNFFYPIPDNIRVYKLSHFNGSQSSFVKFVYLFVFAFRLKRLIKKEKVGIVQSHIYRANIINLLARFFGSGHSVQIVNTGAPQHYAKKGLRGHIILTLLRLLYKQADQIIAKSELMNSMMHQIVFPRGEPVPQLNPLEFKSNDSVPVSLPDSSSIPAFPVITTIYNPFDIHDIKKKIETLPSFDFRKDQFYICYIGRLTSFKKPHWLIESLPLLGAKVRENLEILLIGDGPYFPELQMLAQSLKLGNKIHFLGFQKNPFLFLSKSHVFVLSSDHGEGFPNVLVEAMICGVPVIATDCRTGPREILAPDTDFNFLLQPGDGFEQAEFGMLVPVGDKNAMADAIAFLHKNRKIRETYIKKGLQRARDFSVEKIANQYQEILSLVKD